MLGIAIDYFGFYFLEEIFSTMIEMHLREFDEYDLVLRYTKEDEEVAIYDNDTVCITTYSANNIKEILIIWIQGLYKTNARNKIFYDQDLDRERSKWKEAYYSNVQNFLPGKVYVQLYII